MSNAPKMGVKMKIKTRKNRQIIHRKWYIRNLCRLTHTNYYNSKHKINFTRQLPKENEENQKRKRSLIIHFSVKGIYGITNLKIYLTQFQER